MLVVFLPIFVADTKIIHGCNFVAPLMRMTDLPPPPLPSTPHLINEPPHFQAIFSKRLFFIFHDFLKL